MKKILLFSLFLAVFDLSAINLTQREKEVVVPINFKVVKLRPLIIRLIEIDGVTPPVVRNLYREFVNLEEASYEDLTRFFLSEDQKIAAIDALIELGILQEDFFNYIKDVIRLEESLSEEALTPIREQISEIQAMILDSNPGFNGLERRIQDLEYDIMLAKQKKEIDESTAAALNFNLEDLRDQIVSLREGSGREDVISPSLSDDKEMARRMQEEEYGRSAISDEEMARILQEEEYGRQPSVSDDEEMARRLQEEYWD